MKFVKFLKRTGHLRLAILQGISDTQFLDLPISTRKFEASECPNNILDAGRTLEDLAMKKLAKSAGWP